MTFPDIPVYVVSVRSFVERHEHIRRLSDTYGFAFEFIFEHDASDLSSTDWDRIETGMTPACASTVFKHIECQRRLLATESPMALVLEDDVVFLERFIERITDVALLAKELSPGWLIFLGGADNKLDSRFLGFSDIRLVEHPISTAEAYLIDREGCQRRVIWFQENKITRPADHQLKYTDKALGIHQYWVSYPLATQGSITGKFLTSLDKSRAKHSRLFLTAKFSWNRFRRQIWPRFWSQVLKPSRKLRH